MNKEGEPLISRILGRTLLVLAAISLLIFFDSFSHLYSGYLVKENRPVIVPQPSGGERAVSDQVLVRFKPGVLPAAQSAAIKGLGATQVDEIPQIRIKVLKLNSAARDSAIAALSNNPSVEFAEKNFIAQAVAVPNDPSFSLQWGMTKVQGPQAWDLLRVLLLLLSQFSIPV